MLYAVRSWLVLSHKENPNAQTYLRGHKSPISCLQISVRACDAPDVAPLRTLSDSARNHVRVSARARNAQLNVKPNHTHLVGG